MIGLMGLMRLIKLIINLYQLYQQHYQPRQPSIRCRRPFFLMYRLRSALPVFRGLLPGSRRTLQAIETIYPGCRAAKISGTGPCRAFKLCCRPGGVYCIAPEAFCLPAGLLCNAAGAPCTNFGARCGPFVPRCRACEAGCFAVGRRARVAEVVASGGGGLVRCPETLPGGEGGFIFRPVRVREGAGQVSVFYFTKRQNRSQNKHFFDKTAHKIRPPLDIKIIIINICMALSAVLFRGHCGRADGSQRIPGDLTTIFSPGASTEWGGLRASQQTVGTMREEWPLFPGAGLPEVSAAR